MAGSCGRRRGVRIRGVKVAERVTPPPSGTLIVALALGLPLALLGASLRRPGGPESWHDQHGRESCMFGSSQGLRVDPRLRYVLRVV
jgi:hypothetical protein